MGVGLDFRTAGAVSPDVENAVRAELGAVNAGRPWILCEPIHFFDAENGGILFGGSKLNLHPWPDEFRAAAAEPHDRNDLEALLDALTDWSARFGLTWDLDIDGAPLGRIERGNCPPELTGALQAMADVAAELANFDPMSGEFVGEGEPDDADPPDDPPTGPRLFRG
ncbi:MAG: hypothetical protein JWO38_7668 [Gemmataceae bacterium]|nr:hypothetical protein [Gemmataceae bacterium]